MIKLFEAEEASLKDKSVLFIATKNADYLRITQEKELLEEHAKNVGCIVSDKKGYFVRIIEVIIRLLFCSVKSYDTIFVGFQAQFIIPLFWWKFRKKEVWSDFFISLHDTLVFDRKKIKEKSVVAWLAKKLDQCTLDKSDVIICDTIAHGRYFDEEFRVSEDKMRVLYLEADAKIYYPRNNEKSKEYKDKFVVLYFGSILPLQGIEVILETINLLKKRGDIVFVVVGPVKDKERKLLEGPNAKFYAWLSQEELAAQIAQADLCLAGHFNAEIEKAKRTIPGKAYIYEAMNKPMILGENAANHELFKEDEKHFFVKMGSAEDLASKIEEYEKRISYERYFSNSSTL